MGGAIKGAQPVETVPTEQAVGLLVSHPPADLVKPAATNDDVKPADNPKMLKQGDMVQVARGEGVEGQVVSWTTTDVLVKTGDDTEKWCAIGDILVVSNSSLLSTEVKVGETISTEQGVTGKVQDSSTTEVCLDIGDGKTQSVGIEEVTFLRVSIQSAMGLHNKDWIGESDPYCICQLEGKPESKVQTVTVTDRLNPIWNFEAKMVAYTRGDSLLFECYDQVTFKKDDFLGKATLSADQILTPGGFCCDLDLLDKSGKPGVGSILVRVSAEHMAPPIIAPPVATAAEPEVTHETPEVIIDTTQASHICCL